MRIEAQGAQHCYTMLRGLCLLLSHNPQHWYQAHVHAAEVSGPHSKLELQAGIAHYYVQTSYLSIITSTSRGLSLTSSCPELYSSTHYILSSSGHMCAAAALLWQPSTCPVLSLVNQTYRGPMHRRPSLTYSHHESTVISLGPEHRCGKSSIRQA